MNRPNIRQYSCAKWPEYENMVTFVIIEKAFFLLHVPFWVALNLDHYMYDKFSSSHVYKIYYNFLSSIHFECSKQFIQANIIWEKSCIGFRHIFLRYKIIITLKICNLQSTKKISFWWDIFSFGLVRLDRLFHFTQQRLVSTFLFPHWRPSTPVKPEQLPLPSVFQHHSERHRVV